MNCNVESRKILAQIRDITGDGFLCQLYGCNVRTLQRWEADPAFVSPESMRENHPEKFKQVIDRIKADPRGMSVLCDLMSLFASWMGGRIELTDTCPDKATVEEEMLDDATSLNEFREAIRSGASEIVARSSARAAKKEIDETLSLYLSRFETA